MTERADRVAELDLLAYADGRLDDDIGRREAVECYLNDRPEEAARIAAYRAQNEALREAGRPWVEARVPAELLESVYPRERRRSVPRVAATAAGILLAGAIGWSIGQYDGRPDGSPPDGEGIANLDRAVAQHEMYAADDDAGQRLASGPAVPATWPDRAVTLGLSAPDLRALGLELIGRRPAALDDRDGVQLLYRDADRRFVSVFLLPRRAKAPPRPVSREARGLLTFRWAEGPLSVIVTADPDRLSPEPLIELVQEAVAQARILDLPRGTDAVQADGQLPADALPAGPAGLYNRLLRDLPLQPAWTGRDASRIPPPPG